MLHTTLAIFLSVLTVTFSPSVQDGVQVSSSNSQTNTIQVNTEREKPAPLEDASRSSSDIALTENDDETKVIEQSVLDTSETETKAVEKVVEETAAASVQEETDEQTESDQTAETTGEVAEKEIDSSLPVSVRVNENGELVGKATAKVNGITQPIEAKVTIVRDGVVISRIYSNEDGSFAFPNVEPGNYNMYGTASSYAGQQPFKVLQGTACCDCVNLRMSQYNTIEYSTFSNAPAIIGSQPVGGFAAAPSGGFASSGGGGGFLSNTGSAIARNPRLRLLGIGGIATAIAVSVSDDEASPSE